MRMTRVILLALPALAVSAIAASAKAPAAKSAAPSKPTAAAKQSLCERALEALVPADIANEAAGFFGPVSKKYMPQFEAFERAYAESPDKVAVVAKYLPVAEQALAEARQMRVPARYEQTKSKYILLFDSALKAAKLTVKMHSLGAN